MKEKKYLDLEGLEYLLNTYIVTPKELAAAVEVLEEAINEVDMKVPAATGVTDDYVLAASNGKWVAKDLRNYWGDF